MTEAMVPAGVENALDSALERALAIQRSVVLGYVDRARNRADATPAGVLRGLERRYLASVTAIGAASGGLAATPGAGTAAAVATAFAEIAAFVEATALYTLAVAEVHGYRFDDPETRRTLVLGIVLGDVGGTAIGAAGAGTAHWAPVLARGVNRESVGKINKILLRRFLTHYGGRQGALAVGRALPFGIGAAIGGAGNVALGRASVKAAHRAFGPPPPTLGPRVIEG
jgi:hypothetical protein